MTGLIHRMKADDRTLPDEMLAAQAKAGDRAAFDILIARYREKVLGLCFRLLGSANETAELAADIFAEAYRSLPQFKGEAKFGTWLYRIGLNSGYSRLKKKTRERTLFVSHEERILEDSEAGAIHESSLRLEAKEPSAREILEHEETRCQIRRVLAGLPRDHARILILYDIDQFSYAEIAQMLHCPPGTVMSRLSRAREAFRKKWNEMREEG